MSESKCWHCDQRPATDAETGLCARCESEMRHREAVTKELPKAKDAVEALHRLANSAAGIEALKHALETEHRTNQQLVCRAIVAMLEKWNEDAKHGPGWWDMRNEASVKFAEAIFKNVPEKFRYFPYF